MLNLDLFSLHNSGGDTGSQNIVQLSKLILASHLSKASSGIGGSLESLIPAINSEEDDGAHDNLSANSDADPIVEIAGSGAENNEQQSAATKGGAVTSKGGGAPKNADVIREEDVECDDEPAKRTTVIENGMYFTP